MVQRGYLQRERLGAAHVDVDARHVALPVPPYTAHTGIASAIRASDGACDKGTYTSSATRTARWLSAVPCSGTPRLPAPKTRQAMAMAIRTRAWSWRARRSDHLKDDAVALGGTGAEDDVAVRCDKVDSAEHAVLVARAVDHLVVDELLAVHEVRAVLHRQQPLFEKKRRRTKKDTEDTRPRM